MPEKNSAAVSMAKQRASSLTPARRKEIASLAAAARWSPKTKQDRRIADRIQQRFETAIFEAVDALFEWLKKERKPRALVIHQGTAWVTDPATLDYRVFAERNPGSIVGTYNRSSTRAQVLDDLAEIPACASIIRKAG